MSSPAYGTAPNTSFCSLVSPLLLSLVSYIYSFCDQVNATATTIHPLIITQEHAILLPYTDQPYVQQNTHRPLGQEHLPLIVVLPFYIHNKFRLFAGGNLQ